MSEGNESQRPTAGLGRSAPLLAVVLLLMAGWFGWSAFTQWQQADDGARLEQARDQAVDAVAKALAEQNAQLAQQLEREPVKAALAAGDAEAAANALHETWTVDDIQVLDAGLASAYADPAAFGYARLALLELAMSEGKPVARVVRDGKGAQLGLAAPVQLQDRAAVVYIRQPLTRLTTVFDLVQSPDSAFLGLRQGGFTVVQRGNGNLGNGADALARPVGDTGLRVVAELPDPVQGPMGLGMIACAVVAVLMLAVAVLLLLGRKRLSNLPLRRKRDEPAEGDGVTLQEALEQEPLQAVAAAGEADAASGDAETAPVAPAVNVAPGIFRAYDIRGVVGSELNAATATLIGQAIGSQMQAQGLRDVVVGRDGRLSGPELAHALIDGLRRAGCEVTDIGMAPTPVVYFAAYHLRAGSCVAITGSHNPPEYNGFKIVIGGETLAGEAITALYARIRDGQLHRADALGGLQQREVIADYVQRIADDVQLDRPLKVVADAGNGAAGAVAPQLLEAIGADVIPLYCEVDGEFPNHHPDPSDPHNLEDLVQMVQRFDADLGVAFDGDGDRLGVVTKDGKIIFADRLLMLFAADVLGRNPGAMVIYDVKCSGKLSDYILRNGGSPMMWKTGHSLVKAKMRETDAELAGEMSGHFFFKERWYGFDDGLYAAARLLEILAQREEELAEVFAELPDAVSTPELKVAVAEGTQHAKVALIAAAAQAEDSPFASARLSTIDGLRADFADGWGLVRASNTTPVLVLRFEAEDEAALERIKALFREQLQQLLPEAELPF